MKLLPINNSFVELNKVEKLELNGGYKGPLPRPIMPNPILPTYFVKYVTKSIFGLFK